MTNLLVQVAAADSGRALDSLPARPVAYLPAQHTDFIWAVDGAGGWALVAAALALPLLAGFVLGWWARSRRGAG